MKEEYRPRTVPRHDVVETLRLVADLVEKGECFDATIDFGMWNMLTEEFNIDGHFKYRQHEGQGYVRILGEAIDAD